jgi:hypothetical protein
MSALTSQRDHANPALGWHADVVQLLDEHHLAATSSSPARRIRFASALAGFLHGLRDAEVCALHGRGITDLESFCLQLERSIPADRDLERRIDGPRGVTALLRHREVYRGRPASKYRFYLWHDADTLLAADECLFGRLVDAIAGIAAEAEYVSDDMLLIHRAVFVGGAELERYAHRPDGQMRAWYDDGSGEPFWRVVAGLDAPPVLPFSIDRLFAPGVPRAARRGPA